VLDFAATRVTSALVISVIGMRIAVSGTGMRQGTGPPTSMVVRTMSVLMLSAVEVAAW
jgi:hypothetical protein